MSRAEVLYKLLRLGPLEPIHAREVCGWPVDEFNVAMQAALSQGWIRQVRGCNQYTTRLAVA